MALPCAECRTALAVRGWYCDACRASFQVFALPGVGRCVECKAGVTDGSVCDLCLASLEAKKKQEDGRNGMLAFLQSVPLEYRWASFGHPDLAIRVKDPRAITTVRNLKPDTMMLVLAGTAGSGKSLLAVARARQLVETSSSQTACFVSAPVLAEAARATRLGQPIEARILAEGAGVTILDDVGAEPDAFGQAQQDLLWFRHMHHRRTIVTTGLTSSKLEARYNSGFFRRLLEKGRSEVVPCDPAANVVPMTGRAAR